MDQLTIYIERAPIPDLSSCYNVIISVIIYSIVTAVTSLILVIWYGDNNLVSIYVIPTYIIQTIIIIAILKLYVSKIECIHSIYVKEYSRVQIMVCASIYIILIISIYFLLIFTNINILNTSYISTLSTRVTIIGCACGITFFMLVELLQSLSELDDIRDRNDIVSANNNNIV
jgi:hypothetical protein